MALMNAGTTDTIYTDMWQRQYLQQQNQVKPSIRSSCVLWLTIHVRVPDCGQEYDTVRERAALLTTTDASINVEIRSRLMGECSLWSVVYLIKANSCHL